MTEVRMRSVAKLLSLTANARLIVLAKAANKATVNNDNSDTTTAGLDAIVERQADLLLQRCEACGREAIEAECTASVEAMRRNTKMRSFLLASEALLAEIEAQCVRLAHMAAKETPL